MAKARTNFHRCRAGFVRAATAISLMAVAVSAALAGEPTTKPATIDEPSSPAMVTDTSSARLKTAAWSNTVTALANALVEEGDAGAVRKILDEDVLVRKFNRSQREDVTRLHALVAGMTVLASRGYLASPGTMASDIVEDIREIDLPENVRRLLTPPDADTLKRANLTADKWISTALFTSGNDPVGVIVLWRRQSATSIAAEREAAADRDADDAEPRALQPVFVLVRGHLIDGRYVIRQLCYGDPLPLDVSTAKSDQ